MNFLGQEAISRGPQASGRTLLVFALTLFIFKLGWIETADASVIGLRFREDRFDLIVSVLTGLVAIAHCVQWTGDRLSFEDGTWMA